MIDATGIEKIIPHRGNMRMIDEIRTIGESSGTAVHYVRDDEFWCAGHFPGAPIMPGVLQVEALAQTACFLAFTKLKIDYTSTLGYFTTMDSIKFSNMVRPGDELILDVELVAHKLSLYKFHGVARVGDKKVAEATFTAIMRPRDK